MASSMKRKPSHFLLTCLVVWVTMAQESSASMKRMKSAAFVIPSKWTPQRNPHHMSTITAPTETIPTAISTSPTETIPTAISTPTIVEKHGSFIVHKSGIDIDLNVKKTKDTPVIIFLAGYPDTAQVWSRVAPSFEKTHHVATMAMPDFEALDMAKHWGYGVDEIIDDLHESVVMPYRKAGYNTIHLVGHDWGAFVTLRCARKYPNSITKLVQVDIGDLRSFDGEFRPMEDFLAGAYRLHLALTFLVWRLTGNLKLSFDFLRAYPWATMGPMLPEEERPTPREYNRPFMAYPYFRGQVTGYGPKEPFVPSVPQLFVFGTKKRFMFHSKEYMELTLRTDRMSRCKEYEEAGHYPQWSHPVEFVKDLKEFLELPEH